MAVPSAVLRQRERLEAELRGAETPPADPQLTLVPSAPADPAPTPPAAPAAPTPDATSARIVELEHLLKTRDGQTSTAMREANEARQRADAAAAQIRALEDAVAELTKQKDTVESLAAARRADADLPSLEDDIADATDDEMATYGDSIGLIKRLSKKELLAYMKPLVAKLAAMEKSLGRLSDLDKLPQIEKVIQNSQEETARVKEEEFFRKEVLAYFPDFESIREQQDWKDYINTGIPERGIKIGHQLHQYRLAHDAPGIRSVLSAYYDKQKGKPTLASLAVPGKTQTEGSPVVKPRFKASEYKAKLKSFTQKRLPVAEWNSFKTVFTEAMNEGRVDMDERL